MTGKRKQSGEISRQRAGYLEGIVSIIINTILFALKLWAGIVTKSIAITADAWHTLSDSLSSIFVIVGVKLSSKKPDKEHPFGHGRWEQIAAIFIGVLLAIIAFDFFRDSIQSFRNHEGTTFGSLAIIVTIISIIVKEGLAQYAFRMGKKSGNLSVKADGWHHRTDALSSVVVLAGIFLAKYFWWIDGALGLIISLMLFHATYTIISEAVNKLLGEEPGEDLLEQINQIISDSGVGNVYPHHFHIHNYINHQEMTFHIRLDHAMSIEDGHKIASILEEHILRETGIVSTVHYEPLDTNYKN